MSADTSREAVERLAFNSDLADRPKTAATLRALLAEREKEIMIWQRTNDAMQAAIAERDAARADAARLRDALSEITQSYDRDRPRAGRVDNWDSYEEGLRASAKIARAAGGDA